MGDAAVDVQLPTVPTKSDAREAADAWGFNCGPGAFCGVTGVSAFGSISFFPPQEMGGDWPGYTNPTYMAKALRKYGLTWREVYRGDVEVAADRLPTIEPPGLAVTRIQWGGSWTNPGVPMGARYRRSHWIAESGDQVYDVNHSFFGHGWVSRTKWANDVVPWLLEQCVKGANGKWWPTHIWRIGG